jgi:hypothetical protein
MPVLSLLTTRALNLSHRVGTATCPAYPSSVASYTWRSSVKPLTGSGPRRSRKAQPRPSRSSST